MFKIRQARIPINLAYWKFQQFKYPKVSILFQHEIKKHTRTIKKARTRIKEPIDGTNNSQHKNNNLQTRTMFEQFEQLE